MPFQFKRSNLNQFDKRTEVANRFTGGLHSNVGVADDAKRMEAKRKEMRIACGLEKPESAEGVGV